MQSFVLTSRGDATPDDLREAPLAGADPASESPEPRVIFTSNPLRSLDWLLDLWCERIRPFEKLVEPRS